MFEKASRVKLRFPYKGLISVEDLWDLSIKDLDNIYKKLSKLKKESNNEDSLLEVIDTDEILDLRLSIIKRIFSIKMEEKNKAENDKKKADERRKILEALSNRENKELQEKSVEELRKALIELDK